MKYPRDNITLVQKPFTPHDLLQLVKIVKEIDCKAFTMSVAESLRMINNPLQIMQLKINVPGVE